MLPKLSVRVRFPSPAPLSVKGPEHRRERAVPPDVSERVAGLRRPGGPDDVAGAVVYPASPAAKPVTGHCLVVEGSPRRTGDRAPTRSPR